MVANTAFTVLTARIGPNVALIFRGATSFSLSHRTLQRISLLEFFRYFFVAVVRFLSLGGTQLPVIAESAEWIK